MNIIRVITTIISLFLAGAHYARGGNMDMTFLAVGLIVLLFEKKKWADLILASAIALTLPVWIHTALRIIVIRQAAAVPWHLAAAILATVTAIALTASVLGFLSFHQGIKTKEPVGFPSLGAFLLTGTILLAARSKAAMTILLPDRFFPGSGMALIILMAWYGAWLAGRFITSRDTAPLRLRIWIIFSLVFFAQAAIGLLGVDRFLMTGQLHIPVPAVIIGGPLFRGEGLFMVILFSTTLILTGSAWCSHLCYFGAWDNLGASKKSPTGTLSPTMKAGRHIFLALTIAAALGLRRGGFSMAAAAAAGAFGIAGVLVMMLVSRRRGLMVHCTAWCPLGLLANLGGKLSPFRIKINDNCTSCMSCKARCRYGALEKENITSRKPGLTCSLCGDCLSTCKEKAITYSFPGLSKDKSRILFLIIVSSLHAAFLSLARI